MKKQLLFLLFFTFSLFLLKAQVSLYDDSVIHEIRITSTDTNLWQNLDNDYNTTPEGGDIPYQSVTIEIDGTVLESVGLRQKGFSSNFSVSTTKKPLKINLGKFVDGQKYDGVKKINLGNGVGDPAIAKDKLAYDMFRYHGIPSPRVAHAKVYIQDVYWGIYSMIEQIDKRYLKRNFADNDGNLWKNKGWSNLTWLGDNYEDYGFELQTNEEDNDWSKFIEFVDVINNSSDENFKTDLESIFHVDEYLRILAIDLLINNWDSYALHGRNWYLYHEPKSDKIHWLPWDYNFAFDRDINGFIDLNILNSENGKVLIDRILAIPEWKTKYLNYMCEILQVNMINERIDSKLDTQLGIIENDWVSTNNFFTITDVNNEINGDVWEDFTFGESMSYQGLKNFIEDRSVVMQNNIANQNYTCVPIVNSIAAQDVVINEFMSNNADETLWLDEDGENEDWIELYNNTSNDIDLSNYFLSDHKDFKHKWEFPDNTIIEANSYLIVWPDKDINQSGLHTQFKLDSDEGNIFLSYIDGTIIDSVEWTEEMVENTSLSRFPNGTGDFQSFVVTFNAENSNQLSVDEFYLDKKVKLYPNPTTEELNVSLKGLSSAVQIRITDVLGRQVYNSSSNTENTIIDVSMLIPGIYITNIKNEIISYSEKIIVK